MHTEIVALLYQRFGKQPYWRLMLRDLESCHRSTKMILLADEQLRPPARLRHIRYAVRPFISACQEALQLREHFLEVCPGSSPEAIFTMHVAEVDTSPFLEDVWWFREQILKYSAPEKVVQDSSWVWDEQLHQYTLTIGEELFWLLSISRCIGLIPLSSLRELRNMRIKILGASVAAMTADLLVSLGCGYIECIDGAQIDPSNSPRLPQGSCTDWGEPKASVLQQQLQRRNPYGKYTSHTAKVTVEEQADNSDSKILLSTYIQAADLLIEVVDDVKLKTQIHSYVCRNHPSLPLVFIADLGNAPVVKILREPLVESSHTPTQAAYMMVKEHLPAEHALQFLSSCMGLLPFWSQTPIASRSSAALAVSAVLQLCSGEGALSKDTHTTTQSLAPIAVSKSKEKLHIICEKYLGLD